MVEAKRPVQLQLQAELSAAAEEEHEGIRAAFDTRIKAIENEVDHTPLKLSMELGVSYNFLSS